MFGGFKRFRAVLNAMNAKYTWQELSEEQRRNVDLQARMLYVSGGRTSMDGDVLFKAAQASDTFSHFNEFELFSLYSMAMIEGFIEPATPEPWDPPRNPFSLRIEPSDVQEAQRHFKVNHGIDISLNLKEGAYDYLKGKRGVNVYGHHDEGQREPATRNDYIQYRVQSIKDETEISHALAEEQLRAATLSVAQAVLWLDKRNYHVEKNGVGHWIVIAPDGSGMQLRTDEDLVEYTRNVLNP